jgi:aryl-alcohol dehydrogenase-like predicted oxidoreductase
MPKVPARFAPWQALWTLWQQWLASHPGQAAAACLAYPLSYPEVARVVVGVDSLAQLTELLAAEKTFVADDLPDLRSDDEQLINPSKWNSL